MLFVAGSNTAGRASVAAAAALALARKAPTLLVDADDPAHGMGDVIGVDLLTTTTTSCGQNLNAARLSGPDTRVFIETLLAADKWRRLIANAGGARMAAAFGVPVNDLVGVLDCVRAPPGAEMPVALARLLRSDIADHARHVVVDAGAAVLAVQLEGIPPMVAQGLDGVLRLRQLLKAAEQNAFPSMVASGIRVFIGTQERKGWATQVSTTVRGLEDLRASMAALAAIEKSVLLVLPHRPGRAGERAACRTIERLQPSCIALTGYDESNGPVAAAARPHWLPPGPAVVTLPWGEERPRGVELRALVDAMLD